MRGGVAEEEVEKFDEERGEEEEERPLEGDGAFAGVERVGERREDGVWLLCK